MWPADPWPSANGVTAWQGWDGIVVDARILPVAIHLLSVGEEYHPSLELLTGKKQEALWRPILNSETRW
jgi:hypothetical protein